MSSLTPCNYCSLARIKKRAEEQGQAVTVIKGDVYVHPKGAIIQATIGEKDRRYWVAWMMEIGSQCGC